MILSEKYPLVTGSSHPLLRSKATPVSHISSTIVYFGRDLLALMWEYEWVWLAAPQIGKSLRMCAFTQRDMSKKNRKLLQEWVMVNPLIVSMSTENIVDVEGCLSLPWITWKVARPARVTVCYQDLSWKKQIIKATGYNARILLHEIDHLDGVLFIDKLTD